MDIKELRRKRRKTTAEDFTPPELVNEMLDKLPKEVWEDQSKTFCDPAAGDGNFLVEILKRKLNHNHDPIQALSTIYGVELMEDNTQILKQRLLDYIPSDRQDEAKKILDKNIINHNALTWDFDNWCSTEEKSKELF